MAPYKLKEGLKNDYDNSKDDKGFTIHTITLNPSCIDPLVKFKMTMDCTSYCLQKEYGPKASIILHCQQWKENVMICSAKQKIAVMANVKKRVQRAAKRLRVSSSEEED